MIEKQSAQKTGTFQKLTKPASPELAIVIIFAVLFASL